MSFLPLVIKSEFLDYVKLGLNVGRTPDIDTHIRDMQTTEFEPIVSDEFYDDITGDLSSRPELQSFLDECVKPYIIFGAYGKFLLWHGRNISQFGLRSNNEDTSDPVEDKVRGELLADIRKKTNIFFAKMKKELCKVNYTFDSIVYEFTDECFSSKSKPFIGIKQVGRNRNEYYRRGYHGY